jgi:hypothetical protein
MLVIAYETAVFVQGCMWLSKATNWDPQTIFIALLNAICLLVMQFCLIVFMWNLAFMYWISGKQLDAWVSAATEQDEDPEILGKKITIRMERYQRASFFIKITILVLVSSFTTYNVVTKVEKINDPTK